MEKQAADEDEARPLVISARLHVEGPRPVEIDREVLLCAVAQQLEFDFVAFEFPFEGLGHLRPFPIEVDFAVGIDLVAVDRKDDIAGLQLFLRRSAVEHASDDHSAVGFLDA